MRPASEPKTSRNLAAMVVNATGHAVSYRSIRTPATLDPSGGRRILGHRAGLHAVVPRVDEGRLDAERGERRADLASVVRAVVDRLRQPDAKRRVGRRSVIAVAGQHHVGIRPGQDLRPRLAMGGHLGAELREAHLLLVDAGEPTTAGHD